MQDNLMQVQIQPFVKLVQSNMDLFTRFSTSPEVTAQAGANAGQLIRQANESAMKVMQSGAFAQMVQGMMKNYTDFLTELGQGSLLMLSEGRAAMTRQMEEATEDAVEATEARGRRTRRHA